MENLGRFDSIPFRDLLDIQNDSDFIVLTAWKPKEDGSGVDEEVLEKLDETFKEINLIKPERKVSGIHRITDNVLGEEGRHDYLIEIEGKGDINVMTRLNYGDRLKWLSDFVVNFRPDYKF